jgi:general secretion pathway protein J
MMKRTVHSGFTLIEVMVATSILAVVCALVWGSFQETFRAKQVIETNAIRYHSVRLALERMTREISMAFVSQNEDTSQAERRTFLMGKRKGDIDELRFSYMGHQRLYANSNESDTAQVAYYSARDRTDSRKLDLIRRETRRLSNVKMESAAGEADILCDDVVSLKFSYWDSRDKVWREEWSTLSADGQPDR